jgi:hypothetical protein
MLKPAVCTRTTVLRPYSGPYRTVGGSATQAYGTGDGTEYTRIHTVSHTAVTVYGTVGSWLAALLGRRRLLNSTCQPIRVCSYVATTLQPSLYPWTDPGGVQRRPPELWECRDYHATSSLNRKPEWNHRSTDTPVNMLRVSKDLGFHSEMRAPIYAFLITTKTHIL